MKKLKLSAAQMRWLEASGDCFNQYSDRTGIALLGKGAIRIIENCGSRAQYEITDAGRAALSLPRPQRGDGA